MSKDNLRSPNRTERRKNKRAIEKKRTFEAVVKEMHDDIVYSFEDGPIKNVSLKGRAWKLLMEEAKKTKAIEITPAPEPEKT